MNLRICRFVLMSAIVGGVGPGPAATNGEPSDLEFPDRWTTSRPVMDSFATKSTVCSRIARASFGSVPTGRGSAVSTVAPGHHSRPRTGSETVTSRSSSRTWMAVSGSVPITVSAVLTVSIG